MKLLWACLIAIMSTAVVACAPKMNPEKDCGFAQNAYGERISWDGKIPVAFYVHESVPEKFYPVIEKAMRQWEQSTGLKLFIIAGYGYKGSAEPKRDGANVIYFMNTWEPDKINEQARTSIYWEGSSIKEADIRINEKDFDFYDGVTVNSKAVHFESLMIHELGHVLGLAHQEQGNTVMDAHLHSNTERTVISNSDVESIRCEY